jgi:hypothetical protein
MSFSNEPHYNPLAFVSNWVIHQANHAPFELARIKTSSSFTSTAFTLLISISVPALARLHPTNNFWRLVGGHQHPSNRNQLPQ